MRSRGELFGGSYTQAVLCVFYPPANEAECQRWARSLNITALIGEMEIIAFFASARSVA